MFSGSFFTKFIRPWTREVVVITVCMKEIYLRICSIRDKRFIASGILVLSFSIPLHADWSQLPLPTQTPSTMKRADVNPNSSQASPLLPGDVADNFANVNTMGQDFLTIEWWGGRVTGDPNSPLNFQTGDFFRLRIYGDPVPAGDPTLINVTNDPGDFQVLDHVVSKNGVAGRNRFTTQFVSFDPTSTVSVFRYELVLDLNDPFFSNFEIDQTGTPYGQHWLSIVEMDPATENSSQSEAWRWAQSGGGLNQYLERNETAYHANDTFGVFSGTTGRAFRIQAVPEPASWLILSGLAGFCGIRKRSQRRRCQSGIRLSVREK